LYKHIRSNHDILFIIGGEKMPRVFLYSDPHFSHGGVCRFLRSDGITKLRPWDNPEEMDDELVRRFNERVGVNDKCYFLGDVAINRRGLQVLNRLNCRDLVLIKGNHDIFKLEDYTQYFRDIRGYHVMNGLILSHVPVHSESLARFGANIHGHLHANRVMKPSGVDAVTGEILYSKEIDPRYFNVSVEQIDFTPILFEETCKKIVEQGGQVGFIKSNAVIM
jgi:calcineurin-like phosphoesterase family protein